MLLPFKKIIAPIFKMSLFLLLTFFLWKAEATEKIDIPNFVEWVYDTSVNRVDFYHSITPCNGKNVLFLKLVNNNKNTVTVSWKELFAITQETKKTEGYKGLKQITLQKGQTVEAACNSSSNIALITDPAEISPTQLVTIEDFNFIKINVSIIK